MWGIPSCVTKNWIFSNLQKMNVHIILEIRTNMSERPESDHRLHSQRSIATHAQVAEELHAMIVTFLSISLLQIKCVSSLLRCLTGCDAAAAGASYYRTVVVEPRAVSQR